MVSQMLLSKQLCSTRQATATSISGRPLASRPQQCRTPARRGGPVAAETKEKTGDKKDEKKEEKAPFKPPALDPNTPSPIFGGSTGGLLRKAQVNMQFFGCRNFMERWTALVYCLGSLSLFSLSLYVVIDRHWLLLCQCAALRGTASCAVVRTVVTAWCRIQVEEFYVITWEGKKEAIFEMPTGGAAAMRQGPNLLKLARKEQCLALLTQLRNKFKLNGQFYRVFPNGEVQYLHPKDGQYPEKVTPGRQAINTKDRRIGDNTNPIKASNVYTCSLTFECLHTSYQLRCCLDQPGCC